MFAPAVIGRESLRRANNRPWPASGSGHPRRLFGAGDCRPFSGICTVGAKWPATTQCDSEPVRQPRNRVVTTPLMHQI